jgi:hypothetical protein
MDIKKTYERLKEEYYALSWQDPHSVMPPKATIHAVPEKEDNGGLWMKRFTTMSARLLDGTVGSKTIYVDEESGDMKSTTILYSPDGMMKAVNSDGLTRTRCALMAALSIERFFTPESIKHLVIGFIGNGRINNETERVLRELFGAKQFKYKARNGCFINFDDVDVVISCTTSDSQEDQISFGIAPNASLYIAQDTGWLLDQSFRANCISYSDYPDQIMAHYKNEFPWDSGKYSFKPLYRISEEEEAQEYLLPVAVYLYGVAIADVVVAEAA